MRPTHDYWWGMGGRGCLFLYRWPRLETTAKNRLPPSLQQVDINGLRWSTEQFSTDYTCKGLQDNTLSLLRLSPCLNIPALAWRGVHRTTCSQVEFKWLLFRYRAMKGKRSKSFILVVRNQTDEFTPSHIHLFWVSFCRDEWHHLFLRLHTHKYIGYTRHTLSLLLHITLETPVWTCLCVTCCSSKAWASSLHIH